MYTHEDIRLCKQYEIYQMTFSKEIITPNLILFTTVKKNG
jgi:hypothetical protein